MNGSDNFKQIGRSVYLVEGAGRLVVKYEPDSVGGVLRRFSRKFFRGSLPFMNEMYVNELLSNNSFMYFRHPKGDVDVKSKLIKFEHIDGVEECLTSSSDKERAIKSLIEFSELSSQYSFGGISGVVFRIIESPVLKLMVSIYYSKYSVKIKLKATSILLLILLRYKSSSPILMHNDLQCKNIIKANNGDLYFIDFEDAIVERRLIFNDSFNVLFDKEAMSLDKKNMIVFQRRVVLNAKDRLSDQYLKRHARVCLLRHVFAPCTRQNSDVGKNSLVSRLLLLIIDDDVYGEWWRQQ